MAQAKKKKTFFSVDIPIVEKEAHLQAYEVKELAGRIINYDLTRILRGKGAMLQLKVEIDGEKINAVPRQLKLMPYFLKRMVRKGTNYVEDSFSAKCEDAQMRIKPFLVTRRKVSRKVRKALRDKAREEIIDYIKNKKSAELFDEIAKNTLQKPLSIKLKKIYPLSLCEIRVLKVERNE
jgi:ribosomal protein S3AE